MDKIIFVVDDKDTNLFEAKRALTDTYRVMTLPSAAKMFSLLEKVMPDLILLDIKMPEMDGIEALKVLKENPDYAKIPVIFLTGMTDVETEVLGFQMGVVDFITKPFSAPVLLNRVKTHLDVDMLIREKTAQLQDRTEQLEKLQNSIIYVVADVVENRDQVTGGHIERTTAYIDILLNAMLEQSVYIDEICNIDFESFISSARLHDVGKVSISDTILNKPGKLTNEEFEIMKSHAKEGERIIDQIIAHSGNETFLNNAKLFAGYHHERWDGRGYPYGLSGTDIPLQGRVMSFVDVYDALVSDRPYKKAFTHDEAVTIIMEGSGTQFDPKIAEVFYEVKDHFKKIPRD